MEFCLECSVREKECSSGVIKTLVQEVSRTSALVIFLQKVI